jgi:hypothetical protein
MIKITIETDDKIVGYKDKNAFDIMDCLHLIQLCVGAMFDIEDEHKVSLVKQHPTEPFKERADVEGM